MRHFNIGRPKAFLNIFVSRNSWPMFIFVIVNTKRPEMKAVTF